MALKDLVVVVVEAAAEWRNGGCFKGWKRRSSLSLCIIHGHILLFVKFMEGIPQGANFHIDETLMR